MIDTAMPEKASSADKDAILKRAHVILNSDDFIYVRTAGIDEKSQVARYERKGMYITKDAVDLYERFSDKGEKRDDATYEDLTRKELEHFRSKLTDTADLQVKIKEEELEQFHEKVAKLVAECSGIIIDCDAEDSLEAPGTASSSSSSNHRNPFQVLTEADLDNKLTRWFLKKTHALSKDLTRKKIYIGEDDEDDGVSVEDSDYDDVIMDIEADDQTHKDEAMQAEEEEADEEASRALEMDFGID
jgi:hypothetical protein